MDGGGWEGGAGEWDLSIALRGYSVVVGSPGQGRLDEEEGLGRRSQARALPLTLACTRGED